MAPAQRLRTSPITATACNSDVVFRRAADKSSVPAGERLLIAPSLRPLETGGTQGCVVSVQVFDQASGWTTTYISDPDQ